MYTDDDLSAAVEAGVLDAPAAQAFRGFVEQRRATPAADEERFRLLTGFNDIFVGIGLVLLLTAFVALAEKIHPAAAAIGAALLSWGLAEYFTRTRRMALPSILLLVAFVGACGAVSPALLAGPATEDKDIPIMLALGGIMAVGAAYAHWRRFMVPITMAAAAAAALMGIIGLLLWAVPDLAKHWEFLVLAGGLCVFALAMRWDLADRLRRTRKSDVAFWLHLLAAPLIIHPIFTLIGLGFMSDQEAGAGALPSALIGIAVYVLLAMVALAIDRRALLVSALIYVMYAISAVFTAAGTVEMQFALAALVIGSVILLLSAGWQTARRLVTAPLPLPMREALPAV